MNIVLRLLASVVVVITVIAIWLWNSSTGQDWLLETAVTAAMNRPSNMDSFDGLKVFLCGTSSPLPAPGRAQACVAILAGDRLFVVDAGAGSVYRWNVCMPSSSHTSTPTILPRFPSSISIHGSLGEKSQWSFMDPLVCVR